MRLNNFRRKSPTDGGSHPRLMGAGVREERQRNFLYPALGEADARNQGGDAPLSPPLIPHRVKYGLTPAMCMISI